MKILIVDDQELVRLLLEKCLKDIGYEVTTANNVFDALAHYDTLRTHLVITDINMPMLMDVNSTELPFTTNDIEAGLEIVKSIRNIIKRDHINESRVNTDVDLF
ncbi:response regulator [Flavobacterium flavipallidum]|uniref:Response regulator n=1 Tax=Flavobacterium flavipallidum TaxID=3139140 RepID=A0ABU9HLP5_9FLAO